MEPLDFKPDPTLTDGIRKGIAAHLEKANADDGGAFAISGEVVEIGDDETGQPRIVVHTTREAIRAYPTSLLFRRVTVAAETATRAETEQPEAPHSDDIAVDRFAAAMKAKLADARAKGCGGWDDDEDLEQLLSNMLRAHVDKGDPRDVANFCCFLWNRGEAIAPAPRVEVDEGGHRWRYGR